MTQVLSFALPAPFLSLPSQPLQVCHGLPPGPTRDTLLYFNFSCALFLNLGSPSNTPKLYLNVHLKKLLTHTYTNKSTRRKIRKDYRQLCSFVSVTLLIMTAGICHYLLPLANLYVVGLRENLSWLCFSLLWWWLMLFCFILFLPAGMTKALVPRA